MKHIRLLVIFVFLSIGSQEFCFSQYHEGDTLKFWSPSYVDWPPLQSSPQREFSAICKKAGKHCYVFVEVGVKASQKNIDETVLAFDNSFYYPLQAVYGPVPDVFDHDSSVFIVVLDESSWGGYFDPGQQLSDSLVFAKWKKHSSQKEIIFVADKSIKRGPEMVSHEFGHLLHWNQDHSPEPITNPLKYWEDAWVDEGFSTFAAFYLLEDFNKHHLLKKVAYFTSNPDRSLIYFSSYNQVKLFMLFMFEHYGKWNYISNLISNQLNGISGVESTLKKLGYTESFDDVFEHWIIANYANDTVYDGGKYSYEHYLFKYIYVSENYKSFPTEIEEKTINPYGADYITFTSKDPNPILIDFKGQTNSKFRVAFILKDTSTGNIEKIISIPPDSLNQVTILFDKLGETYNQVVMVVMNVDSSIKEGNTATYSYIASSFTSDNKNNEK